MMIQQYQSHVLSPSEVVAYADVVSAAYPPEAFITEPFVGFRVLVKDMNANTMRPEDRLRLIDSRLGLLRGSGCVIRETKRTMMPDGFWVATFPVPRSQIGTQMNMLINVLGQLEQTLGIVIGGLFEVSVSGRLTVPELAAALQNVVLSPRYLSMLVTQKSPFVMCPFGHMITINDEFSLIRTRWDMTHGERVYNPYDSLREYLNTIALNLSIIFH